MTHSASAASRRFHERLAAELRAFANAAEGDADPAARRARAAALFRRVLFLRLVQSRRWLDGDPCYLSNCLRIIRESSSGHSFHRVFLPRLLRDGLCRPVHRRPSGCAALLGAIPYLGDLFDFGEEDRGFDVPDAAFARLFAFLDDCTFRLDEGPPRAEREINPTLLGHLFEKQINQRESGAYYTGEDVTRYLTRSAVLPVLLDAAAAAHPAAFRPGGPVWGLLRAEPDRYLHAPLLHGIGLPLPAAVSGCAVAAPAAFALPTETWPELRTRRGRVEELRRRLRAGEVRSVNELIRCNLDLERFTEDVVCRAADAPLLRAFRRALAAVTVLDPTCGTGAFLVAAADLLARLAELCLSQMRGQEQPYCRASVLRSILSGNLFGVDRMSEAIEICRLRLCLKWIAACDGPRRCGPPPDLRRHLRAGDALAGAVRPARTVGTAGPDAFDWPAAYPRVMKRGGFDVILGNPPYVEYRPGAVGDPLAGYATRSCGNLWAFVLERCLDLARPGGRVALIVPLSLVAAVRMAPALRLLDGRGAFTSLLALSGDAHPGMLFDGVRMSYTLLTHQTGPLDREGEAPLGQESANCRSRQAERPGASGSAGASPSPPTAKPRTVVSKLYRWLAEERPLLFSRIEYGDAPCERPLGLCPRVGGEPARSVFRKLLARAGTVGDHVVSRSPHRLLYHRIVRHFVKCLRRPPFFRNERDGTKTSEDYKELSFTTGEAAELARAALVSSTFYCVWFLALSDSYHLGRDLILSFPLDPSAMPAATRRRLIALGRRHERDLFRHARRRRIRYRTTGWIEYDEFYPRRSKPVADEIDRVLAEHYGFDAAEVDFIVSYDLKYRMGVGGDGEKGDGPGGRTGAVGRR